MTATDPLLVVDSWLAEHQHNTETARAYATSARAWLAWCEQTGADPLHPTVGECRDYQQHLLDRTTRNATVRARCTAVRSLITHAMRQGHGPTSNPWDEVRIVTPPVKSTTPYLEATDHATLLTRAAAEAGPSAAAIVRIMGVLGLRVAEAARFRIHDVAEAVAGGETVWVYRYRGKGGAEHVTVVDDETVDAIRAAAGERTSGWLFPSPTNPDQPITTRTARRWVADLCAAAGVPRVPPHGLRRSVVTRILEGTGDIRQAQAVLDHAHVTTTARYDRRDDLRTQGLAAVTTALAAAQPPTTQETRP